MNAKVEQILRKQAYDFAIQIGKSEAEAQAEADESILRINKMIEKQKDEVWWILPLAKNIYLKTLIKGFFLFILFFFIWVGRSLLSQDFSRPVSLSHQQNKDRNNKRQFQIK